MLFAQCISLRWHKETDAPKYAAQRRAVRFHALPDNAAPAGEIMLHTVSLTQTADGLRCDDVRLRLYGAEAFYGSGHNQTPFACRLAVQKTGEGYILLYFGRGSDAPKPVILLRDGEYGRILLNERGTYYDTGRWYFEQTVWNFVSADDAACRSKLFFRKVPDHSFSDLRALRYGRNGEI